MNKINLDFSMDAIEKQAFERGKRAGQDKPSKRWIDGLLEYLDACQRTVGNTWYREAIMEYYKRGEQA